MSEHLKFHSWQLICLYIKYIKPNLLTEFRAGWIEGSGNEEGGEEGRAMIIRVKCGENERKRTSHKMGARK